MRNTLLLSNEPMPSTRSVLYGGSKKRSDLPRSLTMSEYAFLIGIFLIVLWALDPWGVYLDQIPVIKHFPIVIVLGALTLAIFGVWIDDNKGTIANYSSLAMLSDFKYLILFAFFVISGSLTAKYVRLINETFLTMGVFTLAAPITAWVILNSRQPGKMIKAISLIYIALAMVSAGLALAKFGSGNVFHNREHLVIPVIGVAMFFTRGIVAKVVAIAFLGALAAAGAKNTAYITAISTVALLLLTQVSRILSREKNAIKSVLTRLIALCTMIVVCLVIWVVYAKISKFLPTGNPEYRIRMYDLAFSRFLDSPIWGDAFSKSAVTHFDLYQVALATQNLPTHSDPLDIAANGGVIGFGLWAFALMTVLWPSWQKAATIYLCDSSNTIIRPFYGFLILSMTGILVSLFNPILNVPNQAFAFWASLGALVACLRLETNQRDRPMRYVAR